MHKNILWDSIKGKENKEKSKEIAKKRLKEILIQDRTNIPPSTLNKLQDDIKKLLNQYFEMDLANFSINFKTNNNIFIMTVNIPVNKVKSDITNSNDI